MAIVNLALASRRALTGLSSFTKAGVESTRVCDGGKKKRRPVPQLAPTQLAPSAARHRSLMLQGSLLLTLARLAGASLTLAKTLPDCLATSIKAHIKGSHHVLKENATLKAAV